MASAVVWVPSPHSAVISSGRMVSGTALPMRLGKLFSLYSFIRKPMVPRFIP
jgi:hypothetical protein